MDGKKSNSSFPASFQPKKITFPLVQCHYRRDMESPDETRILYKLSVGIIENDKIFLSIGVMVRAGKEFDETKGVFQNEAFFVVTEALAHFEVSGVIPQIKSVLEFPMIASMAATVYPFLKEKVTSLLGSNHVAYYLPSFNISAFIKSNVDKIPVLDERVQSKN